MYSSISLMYIRKKIGPKTESCCTAEVISPSSDASPSTTPSWIASQRKDLDHPHDSWSIPHICSLLSIMNNDVKTHLLSPTVYTIQPIHITY